MGEAVLSGLGARFVRVALGAVALAGASAATAEENAAAARPVVRGIEIRSDGPLDLGEVERLIALEVGEPFEEARVRRTLRSLRYAGLAAEAAVSTRAPEPGEASGEGLIAVISLWTPIHVTAVELRGEPGVKPERLRAALPLAPGQPLLEDRVLRGLFALKDLYVEEGFLSATVDLNVALDPAARSAVVIYESKPGPRTRIGAVSFEGAAGVATEADLLDALRSGPGDPLWARGVEENVELLQQYLIRRGFRSARVSRLPDPPPTVPGVVDLAYRIEAGPAFELVLVGAERKALEKRDLLPFLGDAGYDDALVLQSIERLRRDYQERGHYRVEVRRSEQRDEARLRLTLEIVPGPKLTLTELDFEGNDAFPDDRLGRLMTTSPRRLLTPRSGRLVDAELASDLSNLRSFYALEGFDQARIGPAHVEQSGDLLAVRIPVVEGRQRTIASLAFEGLSPLDERELREALPLAVGGPYHRLRVEQGVELVRARLERLGFGGAIVGAETTWSEDGLAASIVLNAIPGQKEVVASLVVRGLDRTDSEIVGRFLGLEVGDPVSREALVEVQRRLYALGVFSRVDVRIPPAGEVGEAREILVDLEEGKSRAASFGLGYDSESGARGLLRLTHGNLFGRISSLTLDLLISQREHHSRLIYRQPYLGRFLAEFVSTAYDEHEERPDFAVDRRGVQVALQRPIDRLSLQLLASYRIVELDAGEFNDDIPLESRNARVASLSQGVSYDRRDDALDPRRGWFTNAQVEYAAPFADADANFLKLFGQGSAYLPIGRSTVLAASLRAGAIEPLADASAQSRDALDDSTPAAELFYAGGRTSHRAYERDSLGIVGETLLIDSPGSEDDPYPAGGGGLLLANVELRFPIVGPVGGTLFLDGGNIWREYREVDPAAMKWGAGAGVRYLSPIGPLRLEIGWKLDREPFEDPYVYYFSLGNSF